MTKRFKLGGAVFAAAALFAGGAMAQDMVPDSDPVDTSVDQPWEDPDPAIDDSMLDDGFGGSGDQGFEDDGIVDDDGYGGSGQAQDFEPMPAEQVAVVPAADAPSSRQGKADMKGLTVLAGGGVEGYTGDLAPQINPGPTWGVTAAIKPLRALGIEVGYSGAVNEIDNGLEGEGATNGADIVRNGGQAVATLGLPTAIQPYVLAGVGIDRYSVRGTENQGFIDDTVGSVPLGVGLRTHVDKFTVDLRGNYGVLFDNEFAAAATNPREIAGIDSTSGARLQGTLQVGGTF